MIAFSKYIEKGYQNLVVCLADFIEKKKYWSVVGYFPDKFEDIPQGNISFLEERKNQRVKSIPVVYRVFQTI